MSKLEKKLPRGRRREVHGGYSFLASGKLPEHRVYLLQYLTNSRQGLLDDLGGEDNLSTAQVVLINLVISKLGCLRCIEEHVRENSVMVGNMIAPSLKSAYLAFSNSLRLDLQALGIRKKVGQRIPTIEQIKAEYATGKRGKKKEEKRAE